MGLGVVRMASGRNFYWLIVVYIGWHGIKWLWDYITPRYEPTEEEEEGNKKK